MKKTDIIVDKHRQLDYKRYRPHEVLCGLSRLQYTPGNSDSEWLAHVSVRTTAAGQRFTAADCSFEINRALLMNHETHSHNSDLQ